MLPMSVLVFAQTLFYFSASIAIIIIGVIFAMAVYHLMRIAKKIHEISDNLSELSEETKKAIEEIIEKLSNLPILSFFVKKKVKKESKHKGRINKKNKQHGKQSS